MKLNQAKANIGYKALLGVLNSTFIGWYFRKKFQINDSDTFPQIMIRDIQKFSIPNIKNHITDLLEQHVNAMIDIKNTNPSKDSLSFEKQIDKLVYRLYNLTEEEIAIVEGN